MYVYIKTESQLWTVGFYDPRGDWCSESDHDDKESAASRVRWLNGGNELTELQEAAPDLLDACRVAGFAYNCAICHTPTGDRRNRLTEQNILRMAAIALAEKGV